MGLKRKDSSLNSQFASKHISAKEGKREEKWLVHFFIGLKSSYCPKGYIKIKPTMIILKPTQLPIFTQNKQKYDQATKYICVQ